MLRKLLVFLLFVTVLAPILLYTGKHGPFSETWPSRKEFVTDISTLSFGSEARRRNLLPQEIVPTFKEPIGVVYYANPSNSVRPINRSDKFNSEHVDHRSRTLYTANDDNRSEHEDPTRQEITVLQPQDHAKNLRELHTSDKEEDKKIKKVTDNEVADSKPSKENNSTTMVDYRVRHLKDQLIRAKVYLSLTSTRNNPQFIRELRLRVKEVQKTLGGASRDSELPKNAYERLKSMEQTLAKGRQMQDDCTAVVKKLRAMLHSTEEQLRVNQRQTMFLTQLTAKTLPKGLHCLPLRLTTAYHALNSSSRDLPNQDKVEDMNLYHYALFTDNILAAAVVVNSTILHAKDPQKHVFHIVTDRLNYAAMKMWFLATSTWNTTVEVQSVEEFKWLNSSYSPVLQQLSSPSMRDYYFKAHRANTDANLKFRNPKYLSILNHLRFYLPEIFPKLEKVLFLDDDVVVQKDLTTLWSVDLKGNVNGAVETCGESFHRFDRYLNFSHPLISKNFDPHACGWAYGMNIFDLKEWRRQNITQVYHKWQELNHDRQLWKLGTLPPGLITFWRRTYSLDKSWHVLGLGYNPNVGQKEIERAAVLHYNGNMKPWLEISIPKYRNYWVNYLDYDNIYLRECNINP